MLKYCSFAATAISLTVSASAFANSTDVPVSYKDLNLASAGDRAKLDRRLDSATDEVCSAHGTYDLAHQSLARECRKIVLSDARQKAQIVVARAKNDQEVASAK